MQKYYKSFKSPKKFYTFLGSLTEKLDTERMIDYIPTGSPKRYYLFTDKGKMLMCRNIKQAMSLINSVAKLNFVPTMCFSRGDLIHVYAQTDYFSEETATEEIVETTVEEVVEIVEEVVEEVKTFDKEYAEGLYDASDKSGSKDKLEEYGLTFGVDLKKNKSFANMLADLEAFVAGE